MGKFILILLLQICTSSIFAQEKLRATEGWGDRSIVMLDTVASLDNLIGRLNSNWKLVSTGKAYWIGYTDDMFSIARYGDTAIKLLTDFINKNTSYKARIGAVYTLHLIGTNSKVTGRFYETFTNIKAREALLHLLNEEDLQDRVMGLLIRDPKTADVKYIMEAMINSKTDCWTLVNGLIRYNLSGIPIHQELPHNIWSIHVSLKYTDPMSLSADYDFDGQIREALDSIKRLKSGFISIEDTLFHTKELAGNFRTKLSSDLSIHDFLSDLTDVSFTDIGNHIQYYYEDGHLYICSSQTAKQRWIGWWQKRKKDIIFN